MFSKELQKLLDLTDKDVRVLKALKSGASYSVTKIAETTSIPRTTVGFILNLLEKRGLAYRVQVQNHHEWSVADQTKVPEQLKKFFTKKKSEGVKVYTHYGLSAIKNLYKRILDTPGGNRVFFLQGNKSAQVALEKIDSKFIESYQKNFKDKKIVMEGFMGAKTLTLFENLKPNEIHSHLNRLIVTHLVPDEYINTNFDIIVHRKTLFFIDIKREVAIEIEDNEVVESMKGIFEFIKEKTPSLNLNKEIKNLSGILE